MCGQTGQLLENLLAWARGTQGMTLAKIATHHIGEWDLRVTRHRKYVLTTSGKVNVLFKQVLCIVHLKLCKLKLLKSGV